MGQHCLTHLAAPPDNNGNRFDISNLQLEKIYNFFTNINSTFTSLSAMFKFDRYKKSR